MDPRAAFAFAILYMLFNGAVLGFMQADLPSALQPSANTWRISTLLVACGCVLIAVQTFLPLPFALGLGNGLIALALTGYWRAVQQFYGRPGHWAMLLPSAISAALIATFAAVSPDWLAPRVAAASVAWVITTGASAWTLREHRTTDLARSRGVLQAVFMLLAVFMTVRAVYFVIGSRGEATVIEPNSLMNLATPIVAAVLPIVGTTSFLLMCSERLRRQWEHAASTDQLTGLANRRTLTDVGGKRLAAARANGAGLAVATIDVDHFKSVNDNHGHAVGDLALKHVATKLRAACRADDLPARQGGEEFVVVFDSVAPPDAPTMAERIRAAIEKDTFSGNGVELRITVSIGVATIHPSDATLDDLLHRADEALYAAKRGGRNRVEVAA